MKTEPWYTGFFGKDYLRLYRFARPSDKTHIEIDNIVQILDLPPGARILDLCCGYGRHTIKLAQYGYEMTGFDLSQPLLQQASLDAEALGVNVHWVQGDMRSLPFDAEFDAIINLYSSFGYFGSETEDQKVLEQVHKGLKPTGVFLQEIGNRDAFVRTYQSTSCTRLPDDLFVLEEREFDPLTSCSCGNVTLFNSDGQRTVYNYIIRIYTLTEITKMLHTANLNLEAYYGKIDQSMLSFDSMLFVTKSRKR